MKKQKRKARTSNKARRKSRLNQLIVIAATVLLAAIMNEALGPPIIGDAPAHQSPGELPVVSTRPENTWPGGNLAPQPQTQTQTPSVAQIPRRDR